MTPKIAEICSGNLIRLAEVYCAFKGIKLATLSRKVMADAPALEKIKAGRGSTTLTKFDFAMSWFDEHWPEDLPWPAMHPVPGRVDESRTVGNRRRSR